MEWYWTLTILLGSVLVLMSIGMPVGIAFLGVNVVATTIYFGGWGDIWMRLERGISMLGENGIYSVGTFSLVPIPMFLLMGELFFHTGLASRMFDAVEKLLGRMPARLSYVTLTGGTVFATLSGSSMGSTALLGTLMVPEMSQRGYSKNMSIGPILGTGGLAILIPPSSLAVILGTMAELDIGRLLIAGLGPGLLLAFLYGLLIYGMARINPEAAPEYDVSPVPFWTKLRLILTEILPMVSVVIVVILMILGGIATPSEAAAFGCLGVILLALVARQLTTKALLASLRGATRVTVMALLIIFGSSTFSQILSFSGGSTGLLVWVTTFDLSPMMILAFMFAVLILLGMFMDSLAMMMLTVPIFFPLAAEYGFNPIWFAVIMLMAMEIGFTTPPFGLLLFVMQGVAPKGTTFAQICAAALPFMGCAFLTVILLVIFPQIALWLPGLSR